MEYCIELKNGNTAKYSADYIVTNENYITLWDEDNNIVQFVPHEWIVKIYVGD